MVTADSAITAGSCVSRRWSGHHSPSLSITVHHRFRNPAVAERNEAKASGDDDTQLMSPVRMLQRACIRPGSVELFSERLASSTSPSARSWVFLHGLASVCRGNKSEDLMGLARREGDNCLRYDARGHGESSGTLDTLRLTDLVEDACGDWPPVMLSTGRSASR